MKKHVLLLICVLCFNSAFSQSILGKWKTIDDETGKEKSIVEIYEKNGKVYGKIVKLLNPKTKNPLCKKCKGNNKNKTIVGLIIINGLEKDDDTYEGGTIVNPENGKIYTCKLKLIHKDKLQVRGYVSVFYKTQYWKRVN